MALSLPRYADLTLKNALTMAGDSEVIEQLRDLGTRVEGIRAEQQRFIEWCDRADKLYYAEDFTSGGADLWPDDPSATTGGRSHVSINTPSVYVDVPSALQSVAPIENMLATDNTEEARNAASKYERVYTAWKQDEDFELKFAKACTVKALYGRTAGKVYWDKDDKPPKPCLEIIEQPRNLFLGYRSDSYDEVEWAAYVTRMDPNSVIEEFGVDVDMRDFGNGVIIPWIQTWNMEAAPSRSWLNYGPARIEVWDYWYRRPKWGDNRRFIEMETVNIVFAGNAIVSGPTVYPEYEGEIPYVPLFNTFIPGMPNGRAELYDVEPLIREKYERVTSGSQMIASGTAGDFWQLVGQEAPSRVPPDLKPKRNQIVAPGPGNRIETITPFIAQYQLEQFLSRIDRETAVVSGLNDLLLGLAPSSVLSSSKAINALISNYESRISMRRQLLYSWRREVWNLVSKVWAKKDKVVRQIVAAGGGNLEITSPSLNPRDEMETATRVINLVNSKLISQRRGMDLIGVDDPETEQDLVREERTDATMFPADVQVMAQLMSALQSLGLQPSQQAQQQAQQQMSSGQSDLAAALGQSTPQNAPSSQLPGDQGVLPPEAMQGQGGAPASAPFAQGPAGGSPQQAGGGMIGTAQTMIQNGQAKSRILTQQQLGRR